LKSDRQLPTVDPILFLLITIARKTLGFRVWTRNDRHLMYPLFCVFVIVVILDRYGRKGIRIRQDRDFGLLFCFLSPR
jgi:hypothetical protein